MKVKVKLVSPIHVVAKDDIPAVLCRGTTEGIKKGTKLGVVTNYWANGEGWYLFTNGMTCPDIFFEEMPALWDEVYDYVGAPSADDLAALDERLK